MKRLFWVCVCVIAVFAIPFNAAFGQTIETTDGTVVNLHPQPQTEQVKSASGDALPRCLHTITRYNLFHRANDYYAYLSEAVFLVPNESDVCEFFYTIKSPILEAYNEEVGNPICEVYQKSTTCRGTIEVGSYVKLNFYTKGVPSDIPIATVEDFTNDNENVTWLFWGIAVFAPIIKS